MIRALLLLAAIAALAFGAQWLVSHPGEVSFTWLGYKAKASVLTVIIALALLAIAAVALWSLIRLIFRLPRAMSLAARLRKRERGYEALSRGLIAIGSGDARAARREAGEAARLLKHEPMTLLLRAQAAQLSGDRATARALFQEMAKRPETKALGLRGLYVEARRAGEADAAFAFAEEAQRATPLPWAAQALIERHAQEQSWGAALETLERSASGGQIDKAELARGRAALKTAMARDVAERDPEGALALTRAALAEQPTLVPAAALAARLLGRRGELKKGSKVVEAIWAQAAHPDLAQAYVDLRPGDSSLDRLARGRALAKLAPNDPESRLMTADLAVAAREFREAREALEPLTQDGTRPTGRVCAAMARLEEADGHPAKAREWWGRAARAPRDKAWTADGVAFDAWRPVSPISGEIGVFEWRTPDESVAAIDLPETLFEPLVEAPTAALAAPDADVLTIEAARVPTSGGVPAQTPRAQDEAVESLAPTKASAVVLPGPASAATGGEVRAIVGGPATAGGALDGAASSKPVGDAAAGEIKPQEAKFEGKSEGKFEGKAASPQPVVFPLRTAPDDPGVSS